MKKTPLPGALSVVRVRALLLGLALVGVGGLSSGCAVSSYTTARNLSEGKSSFWVAPQVMRVGVAARPTNTPFVELGTRYGITDGVEVGARLGAGIQADVKLRLLYPKKVDERLTISIAPGAGYIGNFSGTPTGADGDDLHFFGATLPVYVSWLLSESLELTLGPRVALLMQYVETNTASTMLTFAGGTSLSLQWQLTPGLALVPEVSMAAPFYRGLTGAGAVFGTGDQRMLQVGVGVIWGG